MIYMTEIITNWLLAVDRKFEQICPDQFLSSKAISTILKVENAECHEFLKTIFKSYPVTKEICPERASCLFLIYVGFSKKPEYDEIKDVMCGLETNIQMAVKEFLMCFAQKDLAQITESDLKDSINSVNNLIKTTPIASPSPCTPVRLNLQSDSESPLQQFFQTPQRKSCKRRRQFQCKQCYSGDRVKRMQQQLEEEESERLALSKELKEAKGLIKNLELKLQRETSKNENLIAAAAEFDVAFSDKKEEFTLLEEKYQKSCFQITVLQEDLKYTQNCLKESGQQLEAVEKLYKHVKAQFEELEARNAEMESSFHEIYEKNIELENVLKIKTEKLSELTANYESLASQNVDNLSNSGLFNAPVETLADQLLVDAKKNCERLTRKNSLLNEQMTLMTQLKDSLKNENDSQKTELSLLNMNLSDVTQRNKSLVNKLETLQCDLKSKTDLVDTLHAERVDLISDVERKASEIKTLQDKISNSECLSADLEGKLKDMVTKNVALAMTNRDLESKIKELLEEMDVKINHIDNLDKELSKAIATSEKFKQDSSLIEKLECELENNSVKLTAAQFEIEAKSELIKVLEKERDDLQTELKSTQDIVSSLKENVELLTLASNNLKCNIEDKIQKLSNLQDEIQTKSNQNDLIVKENDYLKSEIDDLTKKVTLFEEEVKSLTGEVEFKNKKIKELLDEIQSKTSLISGFESTIKDLSSKFSVLQSDYDSKITQIDGLEEDKNCLNHKVANKSLEIEKLNKEVNAEKAVVERLEAEILDWRVKHENLMKDFEETKKSLSNEIETKAREVEKLHGEVNTKKLEVKRLEKESLNWSTKYESLEKDLKENTTKLQAELETKNKQVDNLENIILEGTAKLNKDLVDDSNLKSAEIESLKTEIGQMTSQCENLMNQIGALQNESTSNKNLIENLEKVNLEICAKNEYVTSVVDMLTVKNEKLEEELLVKKKMCDDLEKELNDDKVREAALTDQIERLQGEVDVTMQELKQIETQKSSLKATLAEMNVKVEKLEDDVQSQMNVVSKSLKELEMARDINKCYEKEVKAMTKEIELKKSETELSKKVAGDLEEQLKNANDLIRTMNESIENLTASLKISELELESKNLEFKSAEKDLESAKKACENLKCKIEQTAIDFSRKKMDFMTELEMQQRESASTLRQLEAKNLAMEEIKNVAMKKVNDLLESHGQLRRELGDLVANKSVENSMLDMKVKDAESKCNDLTTALADALFNVEHFKSAVQHLKGKQEKLNMMLHEKDAMIYKLRDENANVLSQKSRLFKQLLDTFGLDDKTGTPDSNNTELNDGVLVRIRNFMETKNNQQKQTLTLLNKMRSDIHELQCEKLRLQHIIHALKPMTDFWQLSSVDNVLSKLSDDRDVDEIFQACQMLLESGESIVKTGFDDIVVERDMEEMKGIVEKAKNGFKGIVEFIAKLKKLLASKDDLYVKLEMEYKNLEQRTLSLAEINSRISTEIVKSKNLSSVELSLRDEELTSLKSTVSGLNKRIEELTNANDELSLGNAEILKELSGFKISQNQALVFCTKKKELESLLSEVFAVKEQVDKSLINLKVHVPEMLTVINSLQQNRDALTADIQANISESMRATDLVMQTLDRKEVTGDVNLQNAKNCLDSLKTIVENIGLIETKRESTQDLSDSLEELSVPDRTFPIINLHDDTFSMPPRVTETHDLQMRDSSKKSSTNAWVVSPPKKHQPKVKQEAKRERSVNGECWVIAAGPAPAKPARKTESRKRSDSTSSASSTQSLPATMTTRSAARTAQQIPNRSDNGGKCRDDLLNEIRVLREKVTEGEKQREQYENVKASTRLKFEKQLEGMKAEMKQLYNQEITKHKQEQSRATEELKLKNEELWKENVALKEHNDELRSQLWSVSDKLLQERNIEKRPAERQNLSRQLDKIALQPVDSWSVASNDENIASAGSSKNQPANHFAHMPVEDEDEIFDNRCLDEIMSGRGVNNTQPRQSRLTQLQVRNSMCLPHLKSSYPAETQFDSPSLFRETDLRSGTLPFGSESQSLTDSSGDPSMTKSLLPAEKVKKKEQTSYKRPGPPTPSKNGRLSFQGEVRLTPKRALREQNAQEKSKGTPSRLKSLFTRSSARSSFGGASIGNDENTAPSTPRGKGLRIFQRKPFGGRDF